MTDIDAPGVIPTNWEGCRVTGRFVYSDGTAIPVKQAGFQLTMEVGNVRDLAAPKTVIIGTPITGVLAVDGYIKGTTGTGPDLGVVIAASDDPDVNPHDFTYRFTFTDPGLSRAFPAFSFVAPWNGTVDLADVAPVPTSGGIAVTVGATGPVGSTGLTGPTGPAMTDAAIATIVAGPGPTATALTAAYASQGGADSTQALMALLKNETRDASVLIIGDSTGNDLGEWPDLLAHGIGTDWPKWTVNYRLWDDTATQAYAAPITVQTGTGARTLTFYNASVAGAAVTSWAGARAAVAFYTLTPDLILVSMGHNEQVDSLMWHCRMTMLTESLSSGLPGAELVIIAQNPESANTNQQQRAEVYREIAARRGYGFIDVGQAFLDSGNAPALTIEGIHPNAAGSALWCATVKRAFVYQRNGRRTAQPPSTLTLVGDNQLTNPSLALTAGVPNGWVLTATATAVVDTVNSESATMFGTTGSQTNTAVKFTAGAAVGGGALSQYVNVKRLAGGWGTLAVRVFIPTGQASTVCRAGIQDSTGLTLYAGTASGQGAFGWTVVTRFFAASATFVKVLIYIDSSTGGGTCTIDRVILTPGKYPFGK